MIKRVVILLLALLLAACVPIPAEPPLVSPTAEAKDRLTNLATAIAKLDLHPDATEYMEVLSTLEKCLGVETEEKSIYSDKETTALIIFGVGALVADKMHERYMLSEESGEDAFESDKRVFYQLLLLIDQDCEEYDLRSN